MLNSKAMLFTKPFVLNENMCVLTIGDSNTSAAYGYQRDEYENYGELSKTQFWFGEVTKFRAIESATPTVSIQIHKDTNINLPIRLGFRVYYENGSLIVESGIKEFLPNMDVDFKVVDSQIIYHAGETRIIEWFTDSSYS